MSLLEGLVLNGLDLQSGGLVLEELDLTPPRKRSEFVQSADGDGATLVRKPPFDNRIITAKVRVEPQASMDVALEKLGLLIDQLQEAEKNPDGIPLVWTPAQGTKSLTFYLLHGEVTGLPIDIQSGYFVKAPIVTLTFTCKPFGYGAEVEAAAAKSTETGLSIVTLTVPSVAGDVAAEARLVVTDTAGVGRRFVEWGLENRYYNAATSLMLDSEDMTPVAGKQSTTWNSLGAYRRAGATNGTIVTSLLPEPTVCCTTGNLGHVGTFRVKARVVSEGPVYIRLNWQDGEGPFRANGWQAPIQTGGLRFVEVDLGVITITPAQSGSQKWLGRIEAYSERGPAALDVDYLTFIPALEGYGKAVGTAILAGATLAAFDNFTTGTLSGALNGRTAALGGGWVTSGIATDFTVSSGKVTRATSPEAGPRYAVLGSSLTDMAVKLSLQIVAFSASRAAIVRWSSASNYAALVMHADGEGKPGATLSIVTVVAGVTTTLASTHIEREATALTVGVTRDGNISGQAYIEASLYFSFGASSAALATGGALATGKGGFYDYNPTTGTTTPRELFSAAVFSLPPVPYCIQPSRALEFRSNSTIAQDSTGTFYGPVPEYRGSRFYVPQQGAAKRTSRIIVKADRNDLEETDQQTIGDAFTAQVFVTPRFHVIPR